MKLMRERRSILLEIADRSRRLRESAKWSAWRRAVEWGRILGLCSAVGIKVEEFYAGDVPRRTSACVPRCSRAVVVARMFRRMQTSTHRDRLVTADAAQLALVRGVEFPRLLTATGLSDRALCRLVAGLPVMRSTLRLACDAALALSTRATG